MTSTFADLGVPARLVAQLAESGFTAPFPIQQLTLEDALAGRDLCGKAPTGSGKTLAFGLPVAMTVGRGAPGRPRALVLVPSRELASQVSDVMRPLLEVTARSVVTVYGGTSINKDLQRLRRRVDVVVATPGRLEDLISRGAISLADTDLVVIDEADRMADMGFLPVVRRILDQTASSRQTLLFSATLDGDVDVLVSRYQHDPVRRTFASAEEDAGDVTHVFWPAERGERRGLTARILARAGRTIVFTRTKHGADRLARQLGQDGVTTAAIHGNRSQRQRESALARFGSGEVQALIATDVAARGIHIDDVATVIHYDQPATHKDYVHRSGRTGRAGSDGRVVSLVAREEAGEVAKLQRALALPGGLHHLDLGVLDEGAPARVAEPLVDRGSGNGNSRKPAHGSQPRGGARQRARRRGGPQRAGSGQRNRR